MISNPFLRSLYIKVFEILNEVKRIEKRKQIYEGKAKKVFAADGDHFLIVEYKDDETAFNGLKRHYQ